MYIFRIAYLTATLPRIQQQDLRGKVKRGRGGRRKGRKDRHESRNHPDIKFSVTVLWRAWAFCHSNVGRTRGFRTQPVGRTRGSRTNPVYIQYRKRRSAAMWQVCGGNCFWREMFEIRTFGGKLLAANVIFCGKTLWRENTSYVHFSHFSRHSNVGRTRGFRTRPVGRTRGSRTNPVYIQYRKWRPAATWQLCCDHYNHNGNGIEERKDEKGKRKGNEWGSGQPEFFKFLVPMLHTKNY